MGGVCMGNHRLPEDENEGMGGRETKFRGHEWAQLEPTNVTESFIPPTVPTLSVCPASCYIIHR
eukprot:15461538-Alexandrium_andersonii.AAC.1